MLRLRAVRELLVDEVASLRVTRPVGEPSVTAAAAVECEREALETARRRALLVVVLDAVAILVLFVLRDRGSTFLFLGPAEEAAFTLGVLLVAAHFGFRLGQYMTFRTVTRIYEELLEREE